MHKRNIFTLLTVVLLVSTLWAQSPEKMSYQAIIRHSSGQLVTNQGIGMQVSIIQGIVDGTSVYVETQSATTNKNGLVTIEIGTGTTTDDFSALDWGNGTYFLKTETDPTMKGGTNYTITGTSQLLSVPYALHAKTAESITEGGKTYGDWYLPSKEELNLMYLNKVTINTTAMKNGGSAFYRDNYWSSFERDNNSVWFQGFSTGVQNPAYKDSTCRVRAIRSF